ncbi:adenylate/guanylate cyclase domain-containing protein [Nanoarchaeota archaeon]
MEHKNLTIMFTDIKGFTSRTAKSSRAELKKLLELHDELIEPIFEDFDGKVIKTIGDAFMVRFHSPTNAVLCGIKIQKVLDKYNKDLDDDEKIEVRVAVNSGEVSMKGNDVFGEAVNIAARLEGIADAGDIYFTESVYLAMNKNEIPTVEVGVRRFKGVPDEIKVYKVLREKKAGVFTKKEKAVKRGGKKPFWTKRKKWIAIILGILFLLILIGNANKQKQAELEKHWTEEEIKAMAFDARDAIEAGRQVNARRILDKLHAISDQYGNPDEMEEGLGQLEDAFVAKFAKKPIEKKPLVYEPVVDEPDEDPDQAEADQIIADVKRDIREGDRLNAKNGIDDLQRWHEDGHPGLLPVIKDLQQRYERRFG